VLISPDARVRADQQRSARPATHAAFGGRLSCSGDQSSMVLTWTDGAQVAELTADLAAGAGQVTWTEDGTRRSAPLSGLPDLATP